MFRTTFTALALAAAWGGLAGADEGRPVKILARGPWPHLPLHAPAGVGTDREPGRWVVRSPEELAKAAGGNAALVTVPKALKVPAIDFGKEMLVAAGDGTQPLVGTSGGGPPSAPYAVSITRIDRDDKTKTMTVHWRRVPRGKDQGVLTRPLEAVLVGRFDGEVTFNRLPDPEKPAKDPPPAGTEVKPTARALFPDGWPPEAPRREWVVRSEAELIDPRLRAPEPVLERMREEAKARYEKALKADGIDFAKQMVIGVSGGVQPAGATVEVTRVEADAAGKVLTVRWRLVPRPGGKPPEGVTHPAEVILVDRFAGEVRSREDPAKE